MKLTNFQNFTMLIDRFLLCLLFLGSKVVAAQAVVSPLEKVTEELREMQETVSSVQASLIASVSLIQGNKGGSNLSKNMKY